MPSEQEFFAQRRKWSGYKHEILDKYLRIFCYKLGSAHQDLAFVDAFAGEGRYDDGSDGSPLIAARFNDRPELVDRGTRLFVHACEAKSASVKRLREALRPWAGMTPPRAIIYPHPFQSVLPRILAITRGMPTLFFFDPYGMRHLTVEALTPLLQDRERSATEVLMRVDPVLLARFAGWFEERERDERGGRTAESFRMLLTSLGVNPLRASAGGNVRAAGQRAGQLFSQYLELIEERFEYVQIIPIRPDYWAAPKYFLVHGTDSAHGAAKINDVFSTTEDTLFERTELTRAAEQMLLFTPERQLRVDIIGAAQYVADVLHQRGEMTFIELSAQLAMRFGPDLREKHHRAAVKVLIDQGAAQASDDSLEARARIRLVRRSK